jgi:hypothetical protein
MIVFSVIPLVISVEKPSGVLVTVAVKTGISPEDEVSSRFVAELLLEPVDGTTASEVDAVPIDSKEDEEVRGIAESRVAEVTDDATTESVVAVSIVESSVIEVADDTTMESVVAVRIVESNVAEVAEDATTESVVDVASEESHVDNEDELVDATKKPVEDELFDVAELVVKWVMVR